MLVKIVYEWGDMFVSAKKACNFRGVSSSPSDMHSVIIRVESNWQERPKWNRHIRVCTRNRSPNTTTAPPSSPWHPPERSGSSPRRRDAAARSSLASPPCGTPLGCEQAWRRRTCVVECAVKIRSTDQVSAWQHMRWQEVTPALNAVAWVLGVGVKEIVPNFEKESSVHCV